MSTNQNGTGHKKGIIWDDVTDLGLVPDTEIAKRYGVNNATVRHARKRRGIVGINPTPRYSIDWESVGLGKYTDRYLADILGCSSGIVHKERNKRKIPPHDTRYRTVENQGAYYGESIIDLWLHNNGIAHEFQKKIGPYRVDWLLADNVVWEFVGMWHHKLYGEQYRSNFEVKEKYLTDNGYTVRAIQEAELDTFKNAVDIREILSLCDFACARCKRSDVKHHSFGFCGRCARREKSGKPDSDIKTPLKSDDYFECSKCGSIKKFKRVRDLCNLCNNRKYYAKLKP